MLFGNIEQLELIPFTDKKLSELIDQASLIAKENPDGKYPLAEEGAFVVLVSAETEPASQRKAEIHKYYTDVQIILQGEERIGYSNSLSQDLKDINELENDLHFLPEVQNENFVDLNAGDFALFYPNQIHRPLCAIDQPSAVRKAIIKIPFQLFNQ